MLHYKNVWDAKRLGKKQSCWQLYDEIIFRKFQINPLVKLKFLSTTHLYLNTFKERRAMEETHVPYLGLSY